MRKYFPEELATGIVWLWAAGAHTAAQQGEDRLLFGPCGGWRVTPALRSAAGMIGTPRR
jgi:hypothetical protein